jgi:hypothetical protein
MAGREDDALDRRPPGRSSSARGKDWELLGSSGKLRGWGKYNKKTKARVGTYILVCEIVINQLDVRAKKTE